MKIAATIFAIILILGCSTVTAKDSAGLVSGNLTTAKDSAGLVSGNLTTADAVGAGIGYIGAFVGFGDNAAGRQVSSDHLHMDWPNIPTFESNWALPMPTLKTATRKYFSAQISSTRSWIITIRCTIIPSIWRQVLLWNMSLMKIPLSFNWAAT